MKTRVEKLRRLKNWSQAELADAAGCAQSSISRLETGALNATLETMIGVARALDVSIPELFEEPMPAAARLLADRWETLPPSHRAAIEALLERLETPAS